MLIITSLALVLSSIITESVSITEAMWLKNQDYFSYVSVINIFTTVGEKRKSSKRDKDFLPLG